MTSLCRISVYSAFSGSIFQIFSKINEVNSGEEKRLIHNSCEDGIEKNPSLAITDCHHSACLVMPIGDPRYRFFLSHLHTHERFIYSRENFWLYSILVRQNLGEFWEELELVLNFFSLMILVVHILSLKNPSDATLASLSISIYSRWRTRWRQIKSEKVVWYRKMFQTFFTFNC